MKKFEDVFKSYGADYEKTIGRFLGNRAMYMKFLKKLSSDESLQRMGDALASNQMDDAFREAHTLKGVAANLGLTPLYNALSEIVTSLRTGEADVDYGKLYDAVCVEFQKAEAFHAELEQADSE